MRRGLVTPAGHIPECAILPGDSVQFHSGADRENRAVARLGKPLAFGARIVPFADEVPPFRENGLLATPDGALLIAKARWSGSNGTEYDLVDRRGVLVSALKLPDAERVVGFGRKSVFTAVRDVDDIERLQSHPWP